MRQEMVELSDGELQQASWWEQSLRAVCPVLVHSFQLAFRLVPVIRCNNCFGEAFFNNEKTDIHLFRQAVFAQYKSQWANDIWNKSKLSTFRQIKTEYGTEKYVYIICLKRKDHCVLS